jgi:hypothetical protein
MFQTKVVEKLQTHNLCPITFFANRAVYKIMCKKYYRVEQATDDNTAHAHCMLDN